MNTTDDPFFLLNEEQMSNKVWVEHQADNDFGIIDIHSMYYIIYATYTQKLEAIGVKLLTYFKVSPE